VRQKLTFSSSLRSSALQIGYLPRNASSGSASDRYTTSFNKPERSPIYLSRFICAIDRTTIAAFKAALEKIKAFAGIAVYQNIIDYLLGAFLLFPRLQGIPQDYWLAPKK
jgi:hypothetical protein